MVWAIRFPIVFMSMDMPMMNVGVVRMRVRHRRVLVLMRMRLLPIPREVVHMLVMLIMKMGMDVFHGIVSMFVLMSLCQMQPDT